MEIEDFAELRMTFSRMSFSTAFEDYRTAREDTSMKINYAKAGRFMLMAASVILISGCVSTRITASWKDESYREKPRKIVVLAAITDMTQRRITEDKLVRRLRKAGVHAIQGYVAFPEGEQEETAIASRLSEVEADALLTTKVVGRKKVREYFPGPGYYPPISEQDWCAYSSGFYNPYSYPPGFAPLNPGGYGPPFPSGYSPGYIEENIYEIAETDLYDAETGKIVWSAVSETRIMGNAQADVGSYVTEIVKSLEKKKVIL